MARALVVFESMYGNNQQIATAIAEGIRSTNHDADVVEVDVAPRSLSPDLSLLVVGGPNHATGMTRPADRKDAAKRTPNPLVSTGIGLREWFDQLEERSGNITAAAWDSRMAKPRFLRFFDRAARGTEKRLRQRGLRIVVTPEHFYVTSTTGPLADGELDRARQWGAGLASFIPTTEPAASER